MMGILPRMYTNCSIIRSLTRSDCSRNMECEELPVKFNRLGYRTVALNGKNTNREREAAVERLAMTEEDATDEMQPLG